MLDRKEEHLATGNRPSAAARIKAGVVRRRHAHRVRRASRGAPAAPARRRASRCRTSTSSRTAAARTRTSTSTPASSGRCARPAIRRARFITEILMDELADRVKMDPVEFRIKNLPPEAPNAMWRVVPARGRRRSSAGTSGIRPATRRPGRSRPAWASRSTRGAAAAAVRRRRTARSRRTAASSCGSARRTSAPARARWSRWSPPTRSACRPARSSRRSATRCTRSAAARAAARRPRASARRSASPTVKALDALKEKVAPALGVDAATLVAAERPHPGQGQPVEGHGVGRRVQAHRHRSRSRSTATGSPACRRSRRRGVQFAEVDGRHRDRHRQGQARPRASRTAGSS